MFLDNQNTFSGQLNIVLVTFYHILSFFVIGIANYNFFLKFFTSVFSRF